MSEKTNGLQASLIEMKQSMLKIEETQAKTLPAWDKGKVFQCSHVFRMLLVHS